MKLFQIEEPDGSPIDAAEGFDIRAETAGLGVWPNFHTTKENKATIQRVTAR